ncbi:MAG: FtsH protease activity modulator HflK [Oligoflexus sp.]
MSYQNDDFEKYKAKVLNFIRKPDGRSQGGGGGSKSLSNQSIWLIIGGLVLLLALMNSFYTVQPDEEGVVTRFGKYLKTSQPGLHGKIPWIDKIYKVQSKRRQEEVFGFRKNDRTGRSQPLAEESLMLTGDLNLADVQWMVQYEISDPWKFLFRVQDVPTTIRDVSMSVMRRVVGDEPVGEVLTTARAAISLEVRDLMQETLSKYDAGIRIVTVELQSVTPPQLVRPAFNDVNAAKQEQEAAINRAQREYNRVIPEARGRADQTISEAKAYAIRIVNQARGDAERFNAVVTEYKKSPQITRSRLYLQTMEEVLTQLDHFTIVDESAKGLLPVYGSIATGSPPAKQATGNAPISQNQSEENRSVR